MCNVHRGRSYYAALAQQAEHPAHNRIVAGSTPARGIVGNTDMTETFLNWLRTLIASGDVHPFYCSSQWVGLSHRVLDMDRHECQICKQRGRYKCAELVHHVNHVKDAPDKALDIWYQDADGNEQRNLISVCKDCHETVCHPERLHKTAHAPPLTRERWD